jgi:hypothetical protein
MALYGDYCLGLPVSEEEMCAFEAAAERVGQAPLSRCFACCARISRSTMATLPAPKR